MNLRETLTQVADRLQIAFVIGSVPTDDSGDIILLHANSAAASLFGYPGPSAMRGLDVRALMPKNIAVTCAEFHTGILLFIGRSSEFIGIAYHYKMTDL